MAENLKKVGVTACTGINDPNGTVARLAIYKVLEELRPNDTVLICLPALAAEVEEDVDFVRDYPAIVLDGCEKGCAQKVFAKFQSNIVGTFSVADYRAQYPDLEPESVLVLGPGGEELASIIAADIATKVDEVLNNG